MIERAIIATRQLCKRQSTWLRNQTQGLRLKTADIKKTVNFIQE